jgi:hypothetical protein
LKTAEEEQPRCKYASLNKESVQGNVSKVYEIICEEDQNLDDTL